MKPASEQHYIENQIFDKIDFTAKPLPVGEYEHCTFNGCDFTSAKLSNIRFADCMFKDCNLSLAKLSNTTFRDAVFIGCKLLGLHFGDCNDFLFSVRFENCQLNLSSFYKRKMKQTKFVNVSLHEVDFTEVDLTGALFDNCDFAQAVFDKTILSNADLRTSYNYSLDPELNSLKGAKFSLAGVAGLLGKYGIKIS